MYHSFPFSLLDHAGLTQKDLEKTLMTALSRGGDFSEIFLEYSFFNLVHMEEDIIKETAENISLGLGVRVIDGEKTGFGYTSDLSVDKILKAARTAAAVASAGTHQAVRLHPSPLDHHFYPVEKPPDRETFQHRILLVQNAYEAARKFHPSIKKVDVTLADSFQNILVANSEGLLVFDSRPMIKLSCKTIAENKKGREFGYSGGGGRVGYEYFSKRFSPEDIGREAAEEAVLLCDAGLPPAGEMPVVLAPGHSGVLVHEAVGHLLEADFNRKKTSVFWNKLGRNVADPQVTIYDDPTIPHFRGSYNIDDEGTVPQKTLLIDRGVIKGFLQDRLSARILNAPLTGHGRRQDYSSIPFPRMSNTYVDNGEYDPEEIVKSVDKGFYASKFQGGQVEDSGKFTFSVSLGYLIEKGRITAPVKQASLIGDNLQILASVEMVGNDLTFGYQTGTCGKEGQSLPVSDGCPTMKITKMTVGGSA